MHLHQCTGRPWPSETPAHWFPLHPPCHSHHHRLLSPGPGGISFVPKGLAGAICSIALALTASDILTLFLISLLIFCSLSLEQLLNLIALLKVVALGPLDLAVQPIALPSFLGSCSFLAVGACGNLLAGASVLAILPVLGVPGPSSLNTALSLRFLLCFLPCFLGFF